MNKKKNFSHQNNETKNYFENSTHIDNRRRIKAIFAIVKE